MATRLLLDAAFQQETRPSATAQAGMIKRFLRAVLELAQPHASAVILVGVGLTLAAVIWLVIAERRRPHPTTAPAEPTSGSPPPRWSWLVWLALAVAVGAGLRFFGLDSKTLTHPEAYVPGIPLPAGISWPPPRLGLGETLSWHFFTEVHPPGYYLAMLGWTNLFGTTLTALRVPSAVLGVASIVLIFQIGRRAYDHTAGLIAAAFLALHGLHIYWSQTARMYVPCCFIGLVATWLLLEIQHGRYAPRRLEAAYVAAIVAGLVTEWYFWLVLAGHLLWTLLNYTGATKRLLYLQTFAMILGAHTLTHALNVVFRARSGGPLSFEFVRDYVAFGFLFQPDLRSIPARVLPGIAAAGLLVLAVVLMARGVSRRPAGGLGSGEQPTPGLGPLLLAAFGMTVMMSGLALLLSLQASSPRLALTRIRYVGPISAFPIAALAILPAAAWIGPRLRSWLTRLETRSAVVAAAISPVPILTLIPAALVFAIAAFRPLLAVRAMLIFVPYLLVLLAAGVAKPGSRKMVSAALVTSLVLIFAASAEHFRRMPSSSQDFAAIARKMQGRIEPGDVIFVAPKSWQTTPLFYYLDASRLIAGDYTASLARHPESRVWVMRFSFPTRDERVAAKQIVTALQDFHIVEEISALSVTATVYTRNRVQKVHAASGPAPPW